MRFRLFNLKAVFVMVFCISLAPVFGAAAYAADWTFMVYIGGDNNLSEAAEQDIEEMRSATFGSNVNVVVLAELSNQYSFNPPTYLNDYNTHLLKVSGGTVTDVGGSLNNLNMGDPATLECFIETVTTNYPANHYALIIWDHGDGWRNTRWPMEVKRGAVEDQTSGSFMTLVQLAQGVRSSGVKMDLIDFDACLMAMYEVAYEFIGLTDYMVFSEETEPGNGNPYTPILNALGANPAMSPAILCQTIVTEFKNSYQGGRESITKSAVDMSKIDALHTSVKDLAAELRGIVSTNWPQLNNIINSTQSYNVKPNKDLVNFLNNLSALGGTVGTKATTLANLITNDVVISTAHYSSSYTESGVIGSHNVNNSYGLAIFLPTADELQEGEFSEYQNISSNLGSGCWADFLEDYLKSSSGGSGTTGAYEMADGGFAFGTAWVDEFGAWGDANVDIYVFEPDGTSGSPWISQSTPNGAFSPESSEIGESYEMYCAKDRAMAGTYYVLVNYFEDGYMDDYAYVYIFNMDPGDTSWKLIPEPYVKQMHYYNPAPDDWGEPGVIENIINGYYSDWWLPTHYVTRAKEDSNMQNLKKMLLEAKAMADKRKKVNLRNNLNHLFNFFQTNEN